jgi:hypothetical protein
MNADRFKYSNYSGARSQNKKETCFDYGDTSPFASAQLEEVSKLRETTSLLFWILTTEF